MAECGHRPLVLKCGEVDCCEGCVWRYLEETKAHELASTTKNVDEEENTFLMKSLQDEQRNTSVMLEYLDTIKSRFTAHLSLQIDAVKATIVQNACRYSNQIQLLQANLTTSEGQQAFLTLQRDFDKPLNRIFIQEREFEESLKEIIHAVAQDIEVTEVISPTPTELMADFLDNHVVITRYITEKRNEIHSIEDGFHLYPKSRYCFINDSEIVVTGGQVCGYPAINTYLIGLNSTSKRAYARKLPNMHNGRAEHATCFFDFTPNQQLVYVFGGTRSIEYLKFSRGNRMIELFDPGNGEKVDWDVAKCLLPCVLTTATCVSHLGFVYITGSQTETFKIFRFSPAKDLEPLSEVSSIHSHSESQSALTTYTFHGTLISQPCSIACWHTLIVILHHEGRKLKGLPWTIGSEMEQGDISFKLECEKGVGREVELTAVCPSVTRDSECFVLTEAVSRTCLVRYSFLKKRIDIVQTN